MTCEGKQLRKVDVNLLYDHSRSRKRLLQVDKQVLRISKG